ncbi:hypothetical protein [Streptomyces fractus]|uniref:hypothetical protein n=1 Tax=Streptomyces fractus TaxID=641806 RepID=UPI003CEC7AED
MSGEPASPPFPSDDVVDGHRFGVDQARAKPTTSESTRTGRHASGFITADRATFRHTPERGIEPVQQRVLRNTRLALNEFSDPSERSTGAAVAHPRDHLQRPFACHPTTRAAHLRHRIRAPWRAVKIRSRP